MTSIDTNVLTFCPLIFAMTLIIPNIASESKSTLKAGRSTDTVIDVRTAAVERKYIRSAHLYKIFKVFLLIFRHSHEFPIELPTRLGSNAS